MTSKIFRDPLYNYVAIDRDRDGWLLEVLDTPEVQRMRRIHQLGVSYLTYSGADHNRLSHSLGVVHLVQQALSHLNSAYRDAQVERACQPLLATALLHDVGHGPFSHLFEPCLGIDHEVWSRKIVLCEDKELSVNKVLKKVDSYLLQHVADLIEKNNTNHPAWVKYLLDSQLDVDRLDYLRRDSLFTGADYGHYDHYRILNSFQLVEEDDGSRNMVWDEKALLAVEEYIFARHYMYQNVYLHKTTRGFEKMLEAMWSRARSLKNQDQNVSLIPAIDAFWSAADPTPEQFLQIEEFTVLQQIQQWRDHVDRSLSDLAKRFLERNRFAVIDPPTASVFTTTKDDWEEALRGLVASKSQYADVDMYLLKDEVKGKYNQPYFPEKEDDEQSVKNAIRVFRDDKPVEISQILDRLKPVTAEPVPRVRYYLPSDLKSEALRLRADWSAGQ